jgi:hypothetical protein
MTLQTSSLLYWTPRILGGCFVAFIAMFALDVFDHANGIWQTVVELAMHLVPAAIVLIAVAISWRWSYAGAILFGSLGAWYFFTTWGRMHWSAYVLIAGPCFLLGMLFLLDAMFRKRFRVS